MDRRRKWLKLYLRLRAQTLRGFFDRRKATGRTGGFNFILRLWPFRTDPSKPCRSSWNTPRPDASGRWGDSGRIPGSHRSDRRHEDRYLHDTSSASHRIRCIQAPDYQHLQESSMRYRKIRS